MAFDQTRETIIQTAQRLFARFGFQKTSMGEIAKKARKAKASLYYHFASKEELFREVVNKEIHEIKLSLLEILHDNLPPEEKLEKFLLKRFELTMKAINYLESLRSDFLEHLDFIEDLRKDFLDWEKDQMKLILEEGVQAKVFDPLVMRVETIDAIYRIIRGLDFALVFSYQNNHQLVSFSTEISLLVKGIRHLNA